MSAPSGSSESGAFRERTGLAWQRTGVSIVGSSLVLLRLSGNTGRVTLALILAGGLLGLFSAVVSRRRGRRETAAATGVAPVALLMSLAVTLLLVAELEVVLIRH